MDGYILDTSVLSAYLDPSHRRHSEADTVIKGLEQGSVLFLSTISLAELEFGVQLARTFSTGGLPTLEKMLKDAHGYPVLEVNHHTSVAYAELKTNLALTYLADASHKNRPRWIEDWVDKTSGKKLQVDENDLWICAQAKERALVVVTADRRMKRIPDADTEVRLRIL